MTTLILDQFSGEADGTRLASHAISPTNTPSASWSENGGVWAVAHPSDTAYGFSAALTQPATVDAAVSDCTVAVDIKIGAGTVISGLVGRFVDANGFWFAWFRNDTNQLELYEHTTGTNTLRASTSYTVPASGNTVTMTMTFSGTSITAAIGATSINFSSSSFQTATKFGMLDIIGGAQVTLFDAFTVSTSSGGGGGAMAGAAIYYSGLLYDGDV